MNSLSTRTIASLPGRSLLVKGILCSFILHTGTLSAAYFWWTEQVDHFSLSGRGETVQIEMMLTAARAEQPVRVLPIQDHTVARETAGQEPASATGIPSEIAPQPVRLTRLAARSPQRKPIAEEPPRREVEEQTEPIGAIGRNEYRRAEIEIGQPRPADEFRLTRHDLDGRAEQTITAVEKVAGVENKTRPDFSGNRPPVYPNEALRRRVEGTVLLRLHVDARGQVEKVEIVQSSGHGMLDQSAVKAVRSWRGHPARSGGRRVATVEVLTVHFRL